MTDNNTIVPPGRYWAILKWNGKTDHNAIIGFDEPMATHFCQAFKNGDSLLLWLGANFAEYPTLDSLKNGLSKHGASIVKWQLEPAEKVIFSVPGHSKNLRPKKHHIEMHYKQLEYLPMWTICRPTTKDFPGHWTARMHLSLPNPKATDLLIVGETLDEVRRQLPPGLTSIGRQLNDDPVIEEVWI